MCKLEKTNDKIDPGTLKRLKIKLENAILTLSHFLAEVVYTPEFWNKNFLKFFTTKLQPHSLKVLSKKESFSM